MTSDLVLDSCVIVKLVVPELDSNLAEQALDDVLRNGGVGLALDFATIEVANAIWKQHHRGLIDAVSALDRLNSLFALPIRWIALEPDLTRTFEIALQYDIAVYDAMFVALAELLEGSAITSDVPLHKSVAADFPQIQLLQ